MGSTQEMLRRAAATPDELADLLDALAVEAAAGSPASVELLVWAVDELKLARPTARALLLNPADVDDVCQDSLIAVAETIGGYRAEGHFTSWLNQVVRFKAIAHLRRKREPAGGWTEFDTAVESGEISDTVRISSLLANRTTVQDAVADLPDHYRAAVHLRDIRQLTYDQVATELGINPATARSRVARGRALVAARLQAP